MANKRKNTSRTKARKLQRKIQRIQGRLEIENKSLERLKLELRKKRLNNIKAFGVRNIKIVGAVSRFVLPYVLVGSLTIGGAYAFGLGLPFVIDDRSYAKDFYLEYETDEKLDYEESYNSGKTYTNFLSIITPYTLNEEGKYVRYMREYVVDNDNIESLFDALLSDDIDYILENIEVKKETREEMTSLCDTEADYDVSATLQRKDDEITIVLPENGDANFLVSFLEIVIVAGLSYGWTKITDFSVGNRIRVICGEYEKTILVTEDLKRRIKFKKQEVWSLRKELEQYGR